MSGTKEKEFKKSRVRINKVVDKTDRINQLLELGEKESKIKQYIIKCLKGMSFWETNVLFIGPFDDDHIKVNKREIEKYFEPFFYKYVFRASRMQRKRART